MVEGGRGEGVLGRANLSSGSGGRPSRFPCRSPGVRYRTPRLRKHRTGSDGCTATAGVFPGYAWPRDCRWRARRLTVGDGVDAARDAGVVHDRVGSNARALGVGTVFRH